MQLAVVSAANGTPRDLRAVVPTRLVSATINTTTVPSGAEFQLNSFVQSTGFGPIEAGAELTHADGEVVHNRERELAVGHSAEPLLVEIRASRRS